MLPPPIISGVQTPFADAELLAQDAKSARHIDQRREHYMPQLDGLRTFAVGGVLVSHFIPNVARVVDTGAIGVRLFFVLSGFLISGILLRARNEIEGGTSAKLHLKRFYLRRAMRLYPALFLVVLVTEMIGVAAMRRSWPWHLAYLSNFYFILRSDWDGPVSHLWSLAVEEQFYLVWPLLILFGSKRHLVGIVLVIIVAAPISRLISVVAGASAVATNVSPLSCLDTLGLGALLAVLNERRADTKLQTLYRVATSLGAPAAALLLTWRALGHSTTPVVILGDVALGLVFVRIVGSASVGYRGWLGQVLESRAMRYVGTISYGVYLYHLFVPDLIAALFRKAGFGNLQFMFVDSRWARATHIKGLLLFALYSCVTLAIAALSWHYLERPINRARQKFYPLPEIATE